MRNGNFPYKLYGLLEAAAAGEDSSIVSWRTDGQSFVIHDIDLFTKDVAPRYFKVSILYSDLLEYIMSKSGFAHL